MLIRVQRAASLFTSALLVSLLAGCAIPSQPTANTSTNAPIVNSELKPLAELPLIADPKNHRGESSAVLENAAINPLSNSATSQLPVTVTSYEYDGEQQITVNDVSRILALDLSGSIAATVWGLGFGKNLVGKDISTTFPGTESLPLAMGTGHEISVEKILELNPSVVLTDGSLYPIDGFRQLRDAGISVVYLQNSPSFEGAAQLAKDVAAVLGVPEAGIEFSEQLARDVAAKEAEIAAIAPADADKKVRMAFLYIRGSSGIYYLFGGESGADALIDSLAGIDVAKEIGWEGMRPMTDEGMVEANPDLLFVMTGGLESAGGIDGLLAEKPAIALTNAGKNRRIVDMADGDIFSFGPRSAAVLDALARAVYASEEVAEN